VILLGVAVLALGGCGRKGPLDLPPNSQSYAPSQAEVDAQREASEPSVFDPSYGMNAPPTATKGTKRPFLLDPLLGN
jgi:predicted small lipoprotein YifL